MEEVTKKNHIKTDKQVFLSRPEAGTTSIETIMVYGKYVNHIN